MFGRKVDLREELISYKFKFDLLQKIPCSKQKNKEYQKLLKDGGVLPEGVFPYIYDDNEPSTTDFYTIYEPDLTKDEVNEYLIYKKLNLLNTIKNCAVFFTTLTVISLFIYFIVLLNM